MKKTTVTIITIAALVAVTGGILWGLNYSQKKKAGGFGGFGGRGRGGWGNFGGGNQTYSVKTITAEKQTLHDYVITNGNVKTKTSVQVFPSIGGKIVETLVSLGSHVDKGDVIAKVDPSTAGSHYALSSVTAPISGSILSSPVRAGTQVSANTVVTTIGDIENLQVTANIPERYVAALKPGLKAEITLEAYEGVVFNATIVEVSPVLDAATRTKEIVLDFDKSDERVNAGMFARLKLYTLDYSGKILVPQNALVTNNDITYLFIKNDDNTVSKRTVKTGKSVDGMVQVTDGIEIGECIVTEGMLYLYDGASVKDITNGVPVEENKPLKGEK